MKPPPQVLGIDHLWALQEKGAGIATSEIAAWDTEVLVDQPQQESKYLVVSPYTEREHLLDLETLDKHNRLFAMALSNLRNIREDYATGSYLEIFNWTEVIAALQTLVHEGGHAWKKSSFYIVAFRSQIPPTTVYADLGVLDKAAHIEATASGGFLKYVNNLLLLGPCLPF